MKSESGRWGPYRQASPSPARHRPGARSARRERCLLSLTQTNVEEEILMWFQTFFKSLTSTPTRRQPIHRSPPATRMRVEPLEDRSLPSFSMPMNYGSDVPAHTMVSGDFNGDGRLDLATGNRY